MPRLNDKIVVLQVFFLESRSVGSEARSVRHAWLRLGDGVRDDFVEDFAHSAEIEEDVPTYWQLPAGADFSNEYILAKGLLIDAIAVSGDAGFRPILVDDIDHREFDVLVTRRCETQSASLACLAAG